MSRSIGKAATPGSVAACIHRLFNYSSDVFIKSPLRSDTIIAPIFINGYYLVIFHFDK